jgi:hypothetical protein
MFFRQDTICSYPTVSEAVGTSDTNYSLRPGFCHVELNARADRVHMRFEQRFDKDYAVTLVQTVFRPRRHLLAAASYSQARADAHWIWCDITRELKAA